MIGSRNHNFILLTNLYGFLSLQRKSAGVGLHEIKHFATLFLFINAATRRARFNGGVKT